MALRTQLQQIVEAVRAEARQSTNTSRGIDNLDYIKRVIRRHYSLLVEDPKHDWRHLRLEREDAGKDINAGQRYYDFPTALNTDKPFLVWLLWGSEWYPLSPGISIADYSIYSSDDDVRIDPPQKWDWYGTQYELWPLPGSNTTGGIRFEGHKRVEALTSDTSRADIDDELLILFSAATILNDAKQKDAAAERMSAARLRLSQMLPAKSDQRRIIVGGSDPNTRRQGTRWPRHAEWIRKSAS